MVPKGWEQKKLEELCSLDAPITYGVLKPGEYFCGGIPLLQIKDLCDGSVLSNGLHLISPELDYEYRRSRIIKNDILISLVGTIGRVAKYQSSSEANIHRNIGRIRSNQHEYLFHYLRSDDVQRGITDSASGSSQSALNLSTLRSMLILVPPVIEQKKIAKILSTWDKAISVTEKLLTNSQQQKKALMQQLLTGKKRLLDENGVRFSGEWKRVKLGAIADMNSGGTPKSTVEEYYGGNIPWVSISDMTSNGKWIATTEKYLTELGLNSSSARIYPKNSVLYAMYASIGECSIAAVNLTSSQAILGIRPKDCLNYEFLYFYLTSLKEKIKLQGQQGTQSNLNAGMVKEFELDLPSIREQQKIAAVLSVADAEISTLEKKLACLRDEKKALMQQLLTGKRRVKVDEAVAE
ncbi:restriction endonuclease subunit S [Escherichia coli]|nr:restriction endonuclease subunit S [Escherichia coli]EJH2164351.1 restriction endonuclease subunit S [Escherichia coli]EJH2379522.1 restriction endonuclease subunit S [Escherichia coli]EKG7246215.1 restriction endonuclease subunit S [Escherichia coli]HAW0737589.1 restriction endonuclease subunit S [Escherichia coli]